ncbi:hypothetical protein F5B22DRAFT_645333 [Xylaria bambusicola]|uniref:uncharacterized protein n=1 Tax=Xylaria bambusicola TaxID=326684 RepID=UPI002007643D|nr:uncharacterized protein F5B22DRAFT_645333 [Xylaria bambusicola]KAI0518083.1 hypothetical protein F5B22DRAFT_645333 [Xylaria bambusicola]
MSGLRTSVFQTARMLPSCTSRLLHQTAVCRMPYKDDMDRESLKPKAHEYTQSGTDDEAASKHGDAAFNPNKTSPDNARDTAAQGAAQQNKQNPLESSPADKEFAKGGSAPAVEDQAKSAQTKRSGTGNAPKAGKVNH